MNYEKELAKIEADEARQDRLAGEYAVHIESIKKLSREWEDPEKVFEAVLETAQKVMEHVLAKAEKTKGKVDKVMGGNLLDIPLAKVSHELRLERNRNQEITEENEEIKAEMNEVKAKNAAYLDRIKELERDLALLREAKMA